jgi:hypothetical protein
MCATFRSSCMTGWNKVIIVCEVLIAHYQPFLSRSLLDWGDRCRVSRVVGLQSTGPTLRHFTVSACLFLEWVNITVLSVAILYNIKWYVRCMMNRKRCGRKPWWPVRSSSQAIAPGELRKTATNFIKNRLCPGQATAEYVSSALSLRLSLGERLSVYVWNNSFG